MNDSEENMTACGRDLFRLRTERGLTLGEVARQAGCSTPYLSNVSHGRKHLTPRVAALLDKVLGTAGTFAAYAARPAVNEGRQAGPSGSGELTRANIVPVLSALGALLPGYVAADALAGSATLIVPLTRQVPIVEQSCEISRGQDRKAALEFAARFLEFAGWACQDAGDLPCAKRWTSRALDYALELQDGPTIAYMLMRKAAIATENGSPGHGAGLAEAGLAQPGLLTPRLKAVLLSQFANAAAALGESRPALRAAEAAVAEAVAGESQGMPDLAPYCSPQYAAMEEGAVRLRLGQPTAALAVLEQSHRSWPSCGQDRDRVLCLARLAAAGTAAGDLDRAAGAAAAARQVATGISSRRVSKQLARVERKLLAWGATSGQLMM